MPIVVQHGPNPATYGAAAFAVGQAAGQRRDRERYENFAFEDNQRRLGIAAQERSQLVDAQLRLQQLALQAMLGDRRAAIEFDRQKALLQLGTQQTADTNALEFERRKELLGLGQQGQRDFFELQQKAEQEQYSARQKQELARIQEAMDWVTQQPSWSDQQKQDAIYQLQQRKAGITPRPMPQKESPFPPGTEPGKVWFESGRRFMRSMKGDVKDLGPDLRNPQEYFNSRLVTDPRGQPLGWLNDRGELAEFPGQKKTAKESTASQMTPEKIADVWQKTYDSLAAFSEDGTADAAQVTERVRQMLTAVNELSGLGAGTGGTGTGSDAQTETRPRGQDDAELAQLTPEQVEQASARVKQTLFAGMQHLAGKPLAEWQPNDRAAVTNRVKDALSNLMGQYQSRASAVWGLFGQGITDPAQMLEMLNFDEQGNQTGDFTRDEIAKILTSRDAAAQSRASAVLGFFEQGITDPAQLLEMLNFDEQGNRIGDFTRDEIAKIVASRNAIAPGGYDRMTPDAKLQFELWMSIYEELTGR